MRRQRVSPSIIAQRTSSQTEDDGWTAGDLPRPTCGQLSGLGEPFESRLPNYRTLSMVLTEIANGSSILAINVLFSECLFFFAKIIDIKLKT